MPEDLRALTVACFATACVRSRICGSRRGLIRKYGIDLCRRCFREQAEAIGFKKFS